MCVLFEDNIHFADNNSVLKELLYREQPLTLDWCPVHNPTNVLRADSTTSSCLDWRSLWISFTPSLRKICSAPASSRDNTTRFWAAWAHTRDHKLILNFDNSPNVIKPIHEWMTCLMRQSWKLKLPFVDQNLLKMNLRGGRTSVVREHLWNLAASTTQIRDSNKRFSNPQWWNCFVTVIKKNFNRYSDSYISVYTAQKK